MAEYKLVIVEKYPDMKEKYPPDGEIPIITIGYFQTERALQQWAEDNLGEIDNT